MPKLVSKFLHAGSLRHQMMLYFVFIAVVFLTVAFELGYLVRGPEASQAILEATQADESVREAVEGILDYLLAKIAVAFGILTLGVLLVLTLFIKRVTIPLERIIDGSERISLGDLSVTLPVDSQDELGRLASSINELAANYQEVLRMIEHHVAAAGRRLEGLDRLSAEEREAAIAAAGEHLGELTAVVEDFRACYYESREGDATAWR